jgi:hypothetical protein
MTSLDRNLGNDRALDNLHAILKSGEGIAFVGSGASAGLYPLWYELIDRLAMESVARRRATNEQRNEWSGFASKKPQIVAEIIRETLGDDQYADTLRRIFRPKMGPDGKKYTPIHDALLRMPFRGYVTTNYDPGLIEARHALRPDVTDTGYTTWKDTVELGKWYRGEVFSEHACGTEAAAHTDDLRKASQSAWCCTHGHRRSVSSSGGGIVDPIGRDASQLSQGAVLPFRRRCAARGARSSLRRRSHAPQ